jgi:hypothetical protein
LLNVLIQPKRIRIVVEDECRATFVILVFKSAQNAGMLHAFEDLELALGRSADRFPRRSGRTCGQYMLAVLPTGVLPQLIISRPGSRATCRGFNESVSTVELSSALA